MVPDRKGPVGEARKSSIVEERGILWKSSVGTVLGTIESSEMRLDLPSRAACKRSRPWERKSRIYDLESARNTTYKNPEEIAAAGRVRIHPAAMLRTVESLRHSRSPTL